ncbi:MAG: hypothetical protein JXR96_26050 [Deltaproteobacteria bacterium]|nr:hypothetical protein [Deltaproteobacteria bacterium]
MRSRLTLPLAGILLALLTACGSDAYIEVLLSTPAGEDSFEGVARLELMVEAGQPGNAIFVETYPASEPVLELPEIDENGRIRVILDGYADDALSLLLSSGTTEWIEPEGTFEVRLCFCKIETIKAGLCDCPPDG